MRFLRVLLAALVLPWAASALPIGRPPGAGGELGPNSVGTTELQAGAVTDAKLTLTASQLEAVLGVNLILATEIDSLSELQTLMGGINIIQATEMDSIVEFNALMPADNVASVIFTDAGFAQATDFGQIFFVGGDGITCTGDSVSTVTCSQDTPSEADDLSDDPIEALAGISDSGGTKVFADPISVPAPFLVDGAELNKFNVQGRDPISGSDACNTTDAWENSVTRRKFYCKDGAADTWGTWVEGSSWADLAYTHAVVVGPELASPSGTLDGADVMQALTLCGRGASARQCRVELPKGDINFSTCGDFKIGGAITDDKQGGVHLRGVGGRPGAAAGTRLNFAGCDAGHAAITVSAGGYHTLEGFSVTFAAGSDPDVGILLTAANDEGGDQGGTNQSSRMIDVSVYGNEADATAGPTQAAFRIQGTGASVDDQIDKWELDRITAQEVPICLDINASTTASNSVVWQMDCRNYTNVGVDLRRGSVRMLYSSINTGATVGGNAAFRVTDSGAVKNLEIHGGHWEIETGDGIVLPSQNRDDRITVISGLSLLMGENGNKALDFDGDGSLILRDNSFTARTGVTGTTIDVTKAGSDPLVFIDLGNKLSTDGLVSRNYAANLTEANGVRGQWVNVRGDTEFVGDIQPNIPYDFDKDGFPDTIWIGDFDNDLVLELFDDVQGAVDLLTDTGPKSVRVLAGTYLVPPLTSCDAPGEACYDHLNAVDFGSGGAPMIQLASNTDFECAGPKATIFEAWDYADAGGANSSPAYEWAMIGNDNPAGNSNIHIRNCGLRGGGSAPYGTTSVSGFNIGQRGIQLYKVTDAVVSENYCEFFHHACYFVEDGVRVKFQDNESYRDATYNDVNGIGTQASFYTYVSSGGASSDVHFINNFARDSGGAGFNLRNDFAPATAMARTVVRGAVVKGANSSCAALRGQTDAKLIGLDCDGTPGIVLNASTTAYREDGGANTNVGVLIESSKIRNSTVANAAFTIPAYTEDLTLRLVEIDGVSGAGSTRCIDLDGAPVRNLVMDGVVLRHCGTVGSAFEITGTAIAYGRRPDEELSIKNLTIQEADSLLDDPAGNVVYGLRFQGTGSLIGGRITGDISGATSRAVGWDSGFTSSGAWVDFEVDHTMPYYVGTFALGAEPACTATTHGNWIKMTSVDASSGDGCSSAGGNTNRCRCDFNDTIGTSTASTGWEDHAGSVQDAVEVLSATGLVDNDLLFRVRNFENPGKAIDIVGGGTSDHTDNRIFAEMLITSDAIVTNPTIGLDFTDGVGTNNEYTVRCPTTAPSTCVDRGASNTFAATQLHTATAAPTGSCSNGERWINTSTGFQYFCEGAAWTYFDRSTADAVRIIASDDQSCTNACVAAGMTCNEATIPVVNVNVGGGVGDELTTSACGTTPPNDYNLCPCVK